MSTGTMTGVATGLEPYFSFSYFRSGRLGKFIEVKAEIVAEYLAANPEADPNNLPEWFITTMELSAQQHVEVQCIIQRWIDSSISKTVNAPKGYTVEQVAKVYEDLYHGGAKGGTVYVDGSRSEQILTLTNDENSFDDVVIDETPVEKVVVEKVLVEAGGATLEVDLSQGEVVYGSELGDTCPICRQGEVKDIGGCNSCDQCGMQLKCGL